MSEMTTYPLRACVRADATPASPAAPRVQVRGKFLFAGERKLYLRGVTYGTFAPDQATSDYPAPERVEQDFAAMAASGINSVRVYTVPPRWLLDLASTYGLRVMVGLPWEQHVAFLDDGEREQSIEERVREGVRACAGHPAVLAYAIGNEIPASIVRWHGKRRVERFLHRLYRAAKDEDPDALVTYVNFPSTEYLDLPFLDLVTFNVYLEAKRTLESYLARLQTLAGDRPLLMAEIGLDSRRNGDSAQARTLDWQVRTVFAAGCSGAFVFAWTDEWHRGGHDIEDWDFGLTTRSRAPKQALESVRHAFGDVPFGERRDWPRISVIVCTCNGATTLDECLRGMGALDYPDFEVIVVCDGCSDRSAEIAREHGVQLIETPNGGLGSARNKGLAAATGEIVAYCDDDATPDTHWLRYIAHAFLTSDHAAIGGPNIAPAGDGVIADAVANVPGGPIHVLLSDTEAEHIPGCNCAFRKRALEQIGGWDERFRAAGDDVDVCWRLKDSGATIGFTPAAAVWHHRRNSLRAFWRQQKGYGRAEALLEAKWPERYNPAGHLSWAGRMYGRGLTLTLTSRRQRVYHGTWGLGLFQSLYRPSPGTLALLPLMPEWYLFIGFLAALAGLGALWSPLLVTIPVLVVAIAAVLAQAIQCSRRARFYDIPSRRGARLGRMSIASSLYLVQSFARLWGRLAHGLSPWRMRAGRALKPPFARRLSLWNERWRAPDQYLRDLEAALKREEPVVRRGGAFDNWDLEARSGAMGSVRLRLAVEEHGAGKQLVRLRCAPRWSRSALILLAILTLLAGAAGGSGAGIPAAVLGGLAFACLLRWLLECAAAMGAVDKAFAEPHLTVRVAPLMLIDARAGGGALEDRARP